MSKDSGLPKRFTRDSFPPCETLVYFNGGALDTLGDEVKTYPTGLCGLLLGPIRLFRRPALIR